MSRQARAGALSLACVLAIWQSARGVDLQDAATGHAVEAAAADQPQINAIIYVGNNTQPASATVDVFNWDDWANGTTTTGQVFNITGYFDTGASSILLSDTTANSLGIPASNTLYSDVGVLGSDMFAVSQEVRVGIANYNYTRTDLDVFNTDGTANTTPYTLVQNPVNPATNNVRLQIGPIAHQIVQNPVVGQTGELSDAINKALQDLGLGSLKELNDLLALFGTDTFDLPNNLDETTQMIGQLNATDVIGMPAMKGKVVVIDPTRVNNLGDFFANIDTINDMPDVFLHTYVYAPNTPYNALAKDTNPGIPTTSHHVKLSYASFDRFIQLTSSNADAPVAPTLTHNPFIGTDPVALLFPDPQHPVENVPGIRITRGTYASEGNWLLDTGAVASMISTFQAANLHVHYLAGTFGTAAPVLVDDSGTPLTDQFTLAIGGIGGDPVTLAGFFLDSLLLRTMEGTSSGNDQFNIRFLGAPVLVNDISLQDQATGKILTLDGIFGMNFLISSTPIDQSDPYDPMAGFAPVQGYFDWITFDEPAGILGLNFDPALGLDTATPEPGSLALLAGGMLALLGRRRRGR